MSEVAVQNLPENIAKEFYGEETTWFGTLKYWVTGDPPCIEFDTKCILKVFTKDFVYAFPLPSTIVLTSRLNLFDVFFIHHYAKEYVANKYFGLDESAVLADPGSVIDANIILEAKRLAVFCAGFHDTILKNHLIAKLNNSQSQSSIASTEKKPEQKVSDLLQEKLGGIREDINPSGVADLVTDSELIEVKNCQNWQQAVGQILDYAQHYPDKTMRIHLFGENARQKAVDARKICTPLNIKVSHENCSLNHAQAIISLY